MTAILLAIVLLIAAALAALAVIVAALGWVTIATQDLDEDLDPAWWCDAT